MTNADWIDQMVKETARELRICNNCSLVRKVGDGEYCLPSRKAVHDVLDILMGVLFPGCHGHGPLADHDRDQSLEKELKSAVVQLADQVERAYKYQCELDKCSVCCDCGEKTSEAVKYLVESLPQVQKLLHEDIQAGFEGDPAAKSHMEIVMSYPAVQAIGTYRIAHLLYEKGVALIPRVMTELAHHRTGIDIHPGARIGKRFFIDHGTGVVIGETAIIGNNVKIYQGVTLGAMSFPKDKDGKPIKGVKRHPEVGDNVTIYAEATILGDIKIGAGSTIGGNVWLTRSVPPLSRVNNVQPDPEVVS